MSFRAPGMCQQRGGYLGPSVWHVQALGWTAKDVTAAIRPRSAHFGDQLAVGRERGSQSTNGRRATQKAGARGKATASTKLKRAIFKTLTNGASLPTYMNYTDIRRLLLKLFIGFLSLTALLAIWCLLMGTISDTTGKILVSSSAVALGSICGMSCTVSRTERSRQVRVRRHPGYCFCRLRSDL